MTLTPHERDLARAAAMRWQREELTPAELDLEMDRWLQHLTLLRGDLNAMDFADQDEAQLTGGIAYAEHQIEAITRQMRRFVRAGLTGKRDLRADFAAIKYVDLVGLAETVTGQRAVKSGSRYRLRCPFHDDETPSLIVYPPGGGWWCPVCRTGGQDAASFCAAYFQCSQVEGLRWVQELAVGVMAP